MFSDVTFPKILPDDPAYPTRSVACSRCSKVGHFHIACRSRDTPALRIQPKQVHEVEVVREKDTSCETDYPEYCVFASEIAQILREVLINDKPYVILDSGAESKLLAYSSSS